MSTVRAEFKHMAGNSKMTKYYAGIFVLMVLSVGALIYTFSQAGDAKADKATDEAIVKISPKLDDYISQNSTIPFTIEEAGINGMPSSVKYTRLSDSRYKICVTYKTAANGFDAGWASLLGGAFSSGFGGYPQTDDVGSFDSYGLIYSHKKGENCQTVKPYTLDQTCSTQKELSYNCIEPLNQPNLDTPTITN